jgi:hypothetical protein
MGRRVIVKSKAVGMVKVPNNKVKLFFLLHEEMVEERPFRAAKSVLKKWALALSPACNGRNKKRSNFLQRLSFHQR